MSILFLLLQEFENINKYELDEIREDKVMMELCEEVEKTELFHSEYDRKLYEICVTVENNLM